LTERQIFERDRSVSTADQRERSKRDDERSQHELSCPVITHRINRTGDLILAKDRCSTRRQEARARAALALINCE